jgi:thioredoxin reductase (NADPH)
MGQRRLAIIGSGPAGYSAAVYAARAQIETTLFAGQQAGGQLMLTTEVENYPGFGQGIMGPQLMAEMRAQAERFGATLIDHDVLRVDFSKQPFKLFAGHHIHQGSEEHVHPEHAGHDEPGHHAQLEEIAHEDSDEFDAVILATGAHSIPLGVAGEAEYTGRGVSYCAVCDAAFFRDKQVYVVGGGDAAMEDTLALIKFAKQVTVIHRRDSFRASKIMQQRVLEDNKDKVKTWWNAEVKEIKGNGSIIESIVVADTISGDQQEVPAEGLFVAIGHKPATDFLDGQVQLDEKGYVVARMSPSASGLALAQDHLDERGLLTFPTMTSVTGVFAGGDNVDFRYRQAVTAAGMGVMAALDASWWLEQDK